MFTHDRNKHASVSSLHAVRLSAGGRGWGGGDGEEAEKFRPIFRKQRGAVTQLVNPIRIICQDLSEPLRFLVTFSASLTLCRPRGDEQLSNWL